jgi:aarF domain-containing kinase
VTTTESALSTKVRDLVQRQIDDGRQIGAQVCAYKDGERIVDVWAGRMGPEDERPVQPDTLFSSFSTTFEICDLIRRELGVA